MRFTSLAIVAMSAIVAVSGSALPVAELEARQTCDVTSCVTGLTGILGGLSSTGTALPLGCVTSLLSLNPTTILAECATVLLASGSVLPATCSSCLPVGSLPL